MSGVIQKMSILISESHGEYDGLRGGVNLTEPRNDAVGETSLLNIEKDSVSVQEGVRIPFFERHSSPVDLRKVQIVKLTFEKGTHK